LPLAERFARLAASRAKLPSPAIAKGAVTALEEYGWPGNVRELRHVIERAVTLARGGKQIEAAHLLLPATGDARGGAGAPRLAGPAPPGDERAQIVDALQRTFGNQTEAARLLGISRRTLTNKLEKLAIGRPRKQ
jgi:DNA-binding NtrC family response regulator